MPSDPFNKSANFTLANNLKRYKIVDPELSKLTHIDDNGGGGDDMANNYVTKEELNTVEAKINGKLDVMNEKIGSMGDRIGDKVTIAIRDEFDRRDDKRVQTNRYIMGTWVIGGLSLIVAIVALFMH